MPKNLRSYRAESVAWRLNEAVRILESVTATGFTLIALGEVLAHLDAIVSELKQEPACQ